MVRDQPFHFAQRCRRIPNLAISRGGRFTLVVALRYRRLVNPDLDSAFRFSEMATVLIAKHPPRRARGFRKHSRDYPRRRTATHNAIHLHFNFDFFDSRPAYLRLPYKPSSSFLAFAFFDTHSIFPRRIYERLALGYFLCGQDQWRKPFCTILRMKRADHS
jgi:hypothetical protein